MEHSVKTIPGTWYTITATAPATVIEFIQGEIATLATLKKSGTDSFRPSTTQITVNTEGKFTALPTKAPGAPFLGTGGNVQFTDTEAEQLKTLAANSANLTAHTGDTTAHITEDERTKWNAADTPATQFTETEETILKRGVERGILTRGYTNVFIVDENNSDYHLSIRPPLLENEELGHHVMKAKLSKEKMQEWLDIGSSSEVMSENWYVFSQYPVFNFIDADDKFTDGATYEISAFHTMQSATDADPFRAMLTSQIGPISLEQVKSIMSNRASEIYPIYATPALQIR